MKTKSEFFGVYPMVYALFDKRGALAREPMRRQIKSMLKHRAHEVGVLGLAEISPRLPHSPATTFGLETAKRYAAALGPALAAERATIQ